VSKPPNESYSHFISLCGNLETETQDGHHGVIKDDDRRTALFQMGQQLVSRNPDLKDDRLSHMHAGPPGQDGKAVAQWWAQDYFDINRDMGNDARMAKFESDKVLALRDDLVRRVERYEVTPPRPTLEVRIEADVERGKTEHPAPKLWRDRGPKPKGFER